MYQRSLFCLHYFNTLALACGLGFVLQAEHLCQRRNVHLILGMGGRKFRLGRHRKNGELKRQREKERIEKMEKEEELRKEEEPMSLVQSIPRYIVVPLPPLTVSLPLSAYCDGPVQSIHSKKKLSF